MQLSKLRGVRVPHRKNTADSAAKRLKTPSAVTIPMVMHIGAPAKPVVSPGDKVKVGQLIGEASGAVSSPVYASVSGTVKRVEPFLLSSGQFSQAVVIESDGKQELFEELPPPEVSDRQSFLDAVRKSGVVGLGGAGFPAAVKLDVDPNRIEAIIINGAECEPYITSDTRTMLDDSGQIWAGIEMLQKYLGVKRVIVAIEDNKKSCIEKFENLAKGTSSVEVMALPSMYPQGGEKVLIYNTVGKIVPEGGLPIDVGVIVLNCTTLACIARYIASGVPLVEKCVTVDGSAVKEPKNVIVPIGTPLKEVFEGCGGFKSEPKKVIYGGPMMGIAVPDLDAPVLKNTNALLALDEKDAVIPKTTACIKCGRCVNSCPLGLMPASIETAFELKKPEQLEELKVNLCMECGCCSFVCPARRPLVQVNKLAKTMLRNYQQAKKAEEEKSKAKAEKGAAKI